MEYGKIIRIESVHGIKPLEEDYSTFEGYRIDTDKIKAMVLIRDRQSCCESFGYMDSFEDPKEFIGAELLKIECVDTSLKKYQVLEDLYSAETMFVNFETDKGTFQLAVYNSHNGYYGHDARVMIDDKIIEETTL